MKPFASSLFGAALAAAALSLTGCGENLGAGQALNVVSGHIVMGATPDRPSVGYFRVEGGPRDVELVAVTADLAQRVEMHESVRENNVTTMKPLLRAAVPAKGELVFKQGGKHLMIWGINPGARKMGKLPLTFIFSNGDRIIYDAVIRSAGEGAPATGGDEHKGH